MTLADRRYESYQKAYFKKQAELASYGAEMSSPMFSKAEYKDFYPIAAREYGSSKNVPKKIVEIQAREYTPLQARARARALKKAGIIESAASYGEFKYKAGRNAELDAALSSRYHELKEEGNLTPGQIRELLGVEFFYSDGEDE